MAANSTMLDSSTRWALLIGIGRTNASATTAASPAARARRTRASRSSIGSSGRSVPASDHVLPSPPRST